MVPLEEILLRLGDRISDFFESSQFDLLRAMDADMSKQRDLVKMVLELHPEAELLRKKEFRNLIIRRLETEEARELAELLGIESERNPAIDLMKFSLRKNSVNEERLLGFFGVQVPEPLPIIQKKTAQLIQPLHGLYRHQRRALIDTDEILERHGRVMLHMPTGSGKTRTAMNLIVKYLNSTTNKTVLWLAHSEELCEQAVEEFETAWAHLGDRPVGLRRFFGGHNWEDLDDGLIVAGLGKMWSYVKRGETNLHYQAKDIGLIVFDEAHQSIASTFKLPVDIILTKNPECKLLGLSATPGRTWNDISEDERLSEMYLKQKVSLTVDGYDSPIEYLVKEEYLSNPDFHSLRFEGDEVMSERERQNIAEGLDVSPELLMKLSKDGLRNAQIINKTIDLVRNDHRRILVFAINVKHAETLSSILKFNGFDSACITSNTDSVQRSRAIKRFKESGGGTRILCNYGVLTTGFDAPQTSAAIIARPTTSLVLFSQMVGRVIRGPKVGGTAEAEIWTVVDTNLPGFDSLVGAFTNWEDVW